MMVSSKLAVRAIVAGAAILSVAGFASRANAALIVESGSSFSLDSLIPTGSGDVPAIQVGDLLFYNFQVPVHSNDAPAPSAVTITPETLSSGSGINISGTFTDTGATLNASDFLLTYEVATVSGAAEISDAHILTTFTPGDGAATVTETWMPGVTNAYISTYSLGGSTQTSDSVAFDQAYAHLSVQKDISVIVPNGDANAGVAITSIDQTYSEGGGSGIPEPATLGLLGLGAMGLVARRRR